VMPWEPAPGIPEGVDPKKDPMTIALRTAVIIGVGWLCTAMYTLSWYDLQIWMPLALLGASKLDRLMVLRGAVRSAAYVPGRSIEFGVALTWTSTRVRDTLSPIAQMLVLIAIFIWWKWPDRKALWAIWREKPVAQPAPEGQITQEQAADADPGSRVSAS
jgi:alpha-1,6-mannosyltransferase